MNLYSILKKIKSFLFPSIKTWQQIEYFDEAWKQRIRLMVQYIPVNSSVIDLGCGKMWLQEILPKGCAYYPVDYVSRGENTIVCDFNRHEFPTIKADISFVSGCLEYVNDVGWFVECIANQTNSCIISYCTTDFFPNLEERHSRTWVNHFSAQAIVAIFEKKGFALQTQDHTTTQNQVFVFVKKI